MKNKVIHIIYMVAAVAFLTSCKPQVPPQYIQPDDMEDLIYDYHIAQGVAAQQQDGNSDYNRRLAFEVVLKDHGYTQAQFDSSLVYYYTRADRFQEIYKNVQVRLNEEAEKYGASVSEVQNIASNSLSGDTVDVWTGDRMLMLFNDRPYHLYQFSQKADTTFHAGDSFMLSFNTTWLMQNGNRQATAYLAVTYANDSTTKTYSTISTTGTSTLRIPYCKEPVKEIKGFIMCGMRPANDDNVNSLCVLMINNIQLARFRNKVVDQPVAPQPSMPDSIHSFGPDPDHRPDSMGRHMPPMQDGPSDRPMTVSDMNKVRDMNKMREMHENQMHEKQMQERQKIMQQQEKQMQQMREMHEKQMQMRGRQMHHIQKKKSMNQ